MSDVELTGCRILLVEDDYLIARSLGELLEACGGMILGPAATTERALELLGQSDQVDFAMVDVNLRGSTAFVVANALLARGIPFIFTTGYETSMIPERYHDVAVVQKPFRMAEIARALFALTT